MRDTSPFDVGIPAYVAKHLIVFIAESSGCLAVDGTRMGTNYKNEDGTKMLEETSNRSRAEYAYVAIPITSDILRRKSFELRIYPGIHISFLMRTAT